MRPETKSASFLGWRANPAQTGCPVATVDVHALDELYVEMDVQIGCRAKSPAESGCAGMGRFVDLPSFPDLVLVARSK